MSKISYSRGGKISTAQWENADIHFSIELDVDNTDVHETLEHISEKVDEFYQQKEEEIRGGTGEELNAKEIAQAVRDIRFYEYHQYKFPSVTSIVSYKTKVSEFINITPLRLAQLASRGTIIHKQIEVYIKTGEWCEPETIPECEDDLKFLEETEADVEFDNVDFKGFEEVYPMEYISTEEVKINLEHEYAGRQDIKCIYNNKVTLADIKTGTMSKERELKTFAQLSAYASCPGNEDVEQLMIIPMNHKTKQGYSKPSITDDIETHFLNFLKKRKQLKKDLGL